MSDNHKDTHVIVVITRRSQEKMKTNANTIKLIREKAMDTMGYMEILFKYTLPLTNALGAGINIVLSPINLINMAR